MTTDEQDVLARAYARFQALRQNIAAMKDYHLSEIYVREYDDVLDSVGNIGIDVTAFRVPQSEVKHLPQSHDSLTGRKQYSEERFIERAFFLVKLDAILGYFQIKTSPEPKKIGFEPRGHGRVS